MLKHELIHPKINEVVGRAGHSSKILIADGNYPASTTLGPKAELVSMNLSPGVVSCDQVLAALLSAVPVEKISVMQPNKTGPFAMENDPPVWGDYQATMKAAGVELELDRIERWDFYKEVDTPSVALVIQTADQNLWANILLTVGVRQP
jgi:L-fucose mutarotase